MSDCDTSKAVFLEQLGGGVAEAIGPFGKEERMWPSALD